MIKIAVDISYDFSNKLHDNLGRKLADECLHEIIESGILNEIKILDKPRCISRLKCLVRIDIGIMLIQDNDSDKKYLFITKEEADFLNEVKDAYGLSLR